MKISALLTSAGINIGLCALFLSLYSILRKQPSTVNVYFGRMLAQEHFTHQYCFSLERLVPSPSWILKAWESSEDNILAVAGLDAVVFLRIVVFRFTTSYVVDMIHSHFCYKDLSTNLGIRIFSIAAVICMFSVLPLNYYGQQMHHKQIPSESLDVFTIGNVEQGSKWLWVHCLVLYIISCSACILLYFEYKSIAKMRLGYIIGSPPNPSHFSVLVRAIPWSEEVTFSDSVESFFTKYHASSYLSHQMIYRVGKVEKLMNDAGKICKKIAHLKVTSIDQTCGPTLMRCGLCGGTAGSLKRYNELQPVEKKTRVDHSDSIMEEKVCAAAFVFFKTRYAAFVASQVLQSSNPMLWVTDLAPEPHDVYWSNLWIPYRQLWIRRIATLIASTVFMFLFLIPVTFVQGLSQLDQLQEMLPFLKSILKKTFVSQLVTGYLPSVILQLFLYIVPPTMILFSAVEGSISRSGRKNSACCKVLYFMIWNVFVVNVLSGSVISQLNTISTLKGIPTQLAKAVPRQATFFITYVLTSGWASLSSELMQLYALICTLVQRFILRSEDKLDLIPSFPYHTEVPKLLLFGLLGFTCSIFAPLILPFLLVYFSLGYVVYRNQILNVYCTKYESGGQMWPIVHNTTIFSLVLTQVIALGVFGIKDSPVASGFTIPLIICTLLFNEYCRQRFRPIFESFSTQDLIEMDRADEECGRMEEIHHELQSAYYQLSFCSDHLGEDKEASKRDEAENSRSSDGSRRTYVSSTVSGLHISRIRQAVTWLSMLITFQERNPPSK